MPDLENPVVVEEPELITDPVEDPADDDDVLLEDPSPSDNDDLNDDPDNSDPQPKKAKGVQKRIDELTKQREDERRAREKAERDNERLLALLEKQSPAPSAKVEPDAVVTEDPEPDPEDPKYEDYNQYYRDLARWEARKIVREERESAKADAEKKVRADAEAAKAQTVEQKLAQGRTAHADFDEKVNAVPAVIPTAAIDAMWESDVAADIAYHIATHPAEVETLKGMSPARAVMRVGAIEAAIKSAANKSTAPPRKQTTTTPPEVIKTVSGITVGSTAKVDLDKADMRTYAEKRREAEMKKFGG